MTSKQKRHIHELYQTKQGAISCHTCSLYLEGADLIATMEKLLSTRPIEAAQAAELAALRAENEKAQNENADLQAQIDSLNHRVLELAQADEYLKSGINISFMRDNIALRARLADAEEALKGIAAGDGSEYETRAIARAYLAEWPV